MENNTTNSYTTSWATALITSEQFSIGGEPITFEVCFDGFDNQTTTSLEDFFVIKEKDERPPWHPWKGRD